MGKKSLPLNERNVQKMAAGETLRDDKVTGFMLRALATKKVFYYYYRTKAGRERKPSLGKYGELTITQAREIAKQYAAEVAKGNDPSLKHADSRRAPTVNELWNKYYTQHVLKTVSNTNEVKRYWTKYILPALGHRKVADLEYQDCYDLHERITRKGYPVMANRVKESFSNALKMSVELWKWIEQNPCAGVKANKEEERLIAVEPYHLLALAKALDDFQHKYPFVVALVRVILFTGARKSEWMTAKREWLVVDPTGESGVLKLPGKQKGTKGRKDKKIIVPKAALEVLNSLPIINDYFFPAMQSRGNKPGRPGHMKTEKNAWRRIRASQPILMDVGGYGPLRIHDLRHTFATYGTFYVGDHVTVGKLLGHKKANTTRRYVGLLTTPGQDIANATADTIAANMKGEASVF